MATIGCVYTVDPKLRTPEDLVKALFRERYHDCLAAGFPVASGVIEGACRHLAKDRMERAGMRWTIDGAQAMLDLRSTYINDQWSPRFSCSTLIVGFLPRP